MTSPFREYVEAAISKGIDYLILHQDKDGFWREFDLQPGASECWTTAWVGWCLTQATCADHLRQSRVEACCRRALAALWHARREAGWGYNRATGPDADTISWVLRFSAACGMRTDPVAYLAPYIDPGGRVHTFRESEFGSWSDAHDDVAANVGLALLTAPDAQVLTARVKQYLCGHFPGQTFWWSTPTYGVAWIVRFLSAAGGLPDGIRSSADNWISGLAETDVPMEVAHRLLAIAETDITGRASVVLVNQLLDLAGADGWPGSSLLLVPPRDGVGEAAPNAELRGLITTALCVCVLSEWIYRGAPSGVRNNQYIAVG